MQSNNKKNIEKNLCLQLLIILFFLNDNKTLVQATCIGLLFPFYCSFKNLYSAMI